MTTKTPRHVAIIMDGNRRWAGEHGLEEIEGHKRGVERIKELVAAATQKNIESITFWAFSTENWKRDQKFINDIFTLFRRTLSNKSEFFDKLVENGGQVHVLGDFSKFPKDIFTKINELLSWPGPKKKTINVNIALNYGGRDELVRAFRKIIDHGYKPSEITQDLISSYLDTTGQPDVDILIRTGGELRTSGFLLWQLNYAEFYFTKTYFPDFGKEEFERALEDFSLRNRRFGGNNPDAKS